MSTPYILLFYIHPILHDCHNVIHQLKCEYSTNLNYSYTKNLYAAYHLIHYYTVMN